MLHNRIIAITLYVAILSIGAFGCQRTNIEITKPNISTQRSALLDHNSNSSGMQPITKDEFISAIDVLKPTLPDIQKEYDWNVSSFDSFIRQINLDNGEKVIFTVAWMGYSGTRSPVIIFKRDGDKNTPLYFTIPGRDIISVRQINQQFDNKILLEIVSYVDRGMTGGQCVELLAIDGEKVSAVWDYDETGYDTNFNPETRIGKHIYFTATHLVIASFFPDPKGNQSYPVILVNETTEIENFKTPVGEKEKLINKEITTAQKMFYWDEQSGRFGKEKTIYSNNTMGQDIVNNNNSQKDPSVKVIFDYVQNINNKDYSKALDNFGNILKFSYSDTEETNLKKIKNMEIQKLLDKTDKSGSEPNWAVNERNTGKVYAYRVFYAEINMKLSNEPVGYLKNGTNYFKIVTVKEKNNSEWKIGEMSSAEASWEKE